jgi:hypothetical protein
MRLFLLAARRCPMDTATIYTADAKPHTVSEGTADDPATIISVEISAIFDA